MLVSQGKSFAGELGFLEKRFQQTLSGTRIPFQELSSKLSFVCESQRFGCLSLPPFLTENTPGGALKLFMA